jgi:hypothetical protein
VTRLENEILPPVPTPENKTDVETHPDDKRRVGAAPDAFTVGPNPNIATTARNSFRPSLVRGDWTIDSGELVQPTLARDVWFDDNTFPIIITGPEALSRYDLSVELEKTGGRDAMGIFFHWLGPGHYRRFDLARNSEIDFACAHDGKLSRTDVSSKRFDYSSNQWHSLKLEVRGETFRGYIDDLLQFEQTDARFTHGRICFYTWGAAARFRRIKVTDPQGRVLFEGLPELPDNKIAIHTVSGGNRPRLLTAAEAAAKSAQEKLAEALKTPIIATNSLAMHSH